MTIAEKTLSNTTTKSPRSFARRPARAWWAAAALLVTTAACEAMDPASLIEKTRVIGARIEVEGAPERATPAPRESVTVTWLVTAPGEMPPIGWAFAACPARAGVPVCDDPGQWFGTFSGHEQTPVIKLTVPAAEQLGGASQIALIGRICTASQPVFDAQGIPACAGGSDGTTATLVVPLQMAGGQNRNPALKAAPLWFDGQPWHAQAHANTSCGDLPQVKIGSVDHVLRLGTTADDREWYTAMEGDPLVPVQKREALQISQFTTAGKLEKGFSTVEAIDASDTPAVEIKWTAPEADKVPADGIVRFTFVMRDMRGGADWTTRAVCVVK